MIYIVWERESCEYRDYITIAGIYYEKERAEQEKAILTKNNQFNFFSYYITEEFIT